MPNPGTAGGSVDIRADLPPVCDQINRPTCLAFATTTAHEWARRAGGYVGLSVEMLFWACSQIDPVVASGLTVSTVALALQIQGQCPDADWPYDATIGATPASPP